MNKGLLKLFSPKRASKVSIVPPVPGNQRQDIAVVAIMLKLRLIEQNSYSNEDAVQFLKRHKINTTEEFQRDL